MYGNVPANDTEATGLKIRSWRIRNRYKIVDIQDVFDFNTPQAIYKWESGRSLPTIENLLALSMIFGCRVEDLIVLKGD